KAATKKAAPKKKTTPKAKAASGNGEAKDKKLSAIDAAAKVLTDTKQAMNAKELIEAMAAKKLWTSPGGKTPHATLYSAILREINTKGNDARFKKTERGKFAANG
ncbi:MAG: winged helix-turn-helix domain-containing protein, partial [Planctomycetales bacterium]|nr:winged helix-turn-helix domain-containing protein [Planctomycetales bacterium]